MINYAIKTNLQGVTVVQSSVESNNLTHVTEKDITSFYLKMSQSAFLDTGLLPVDGTGLLAYRQAGNHAQIVVQRSPSVNRIIWGKSERDPEAKEYFVAQPYQIYIGDILDDNFYGARIFYSPNPITSPNDPLYHTNLPNTNCRGYRGNGVGWVCLYHTEVWKNFPLGEKMARLIERCSGSEAYNDANMSETDGARFYRDHYQRQNAHLWNPVEWQLKTEKDGISWVIDQNIWIPVLVQGIDNQSYHYEEGVPLTIGMALTGNYAAYYNDSYLPKPVNSIVRQLDTNVNVMNLIKKAYVNSSSVSTVVQKPQDPYTYAVEVRQTNVTKLSKPQIEQEDEDEEEETSNHICTSCSTEIHSDDIYISPDSETFCADCFHEHYVIVDDGNTYSKEDCVWIEDLDLWVHANYAVYCDCGTPYIEEAKFQSDLPSQLRFKHWCITVDEQKLCVECCLKTDNEINAVLFEDSPQIVKCAVTQIPFPSNPKYGFKHVVVPHFDSNGNVINSFVPEHYYNDINHWPKVSPCPCGKIQNNLNQVDLIWPASPESLQDMSPDTKIPIKLVNPCVALNQLYDNPSKVEIHNNFTYGWACSQCCVHKPKSNDPMAYEWDPQSIDISVYSISNLELIHTTHTKNQNSKNNELPF